MSLDILYYIARLQRQSSRILNRFYSIVGKNQKKLETGKVVRALKTRSVVQKIPLLIVRIQCIVRYLI